VRGAATFAGPRNTQKSESFGVVWLISVGGNMIPQKMSFAIGKVAFI